MSTVLFTRPEGGWASIDWSHTVEKLEDGTYCIRRGDAIVQTVRTLGAADRYVQEAMK